MKSRLLMVIVAATTVAAGAYAGVTMDVGYDFHIADSAQSRVSATIDAVEMGRDVPLAVTGEAAVDLTLEVMACNDDGVATMRGTFGEVDATLMGERHNARTPRPVELRVDRRGSLVDLGESGAQEIDLFGSGGVPLQLVVLLAGVVEMPREPLHLGDSWTIERRQPLLQAGDVTVVVTSRIAEISATEIVVVSDLQASLPDFSTSNPLHGGDVEVQQGVIVIEGMTRRIDAQTGLLTSAAAEMRFDGRAVIGPFAPLPLMVKSTFAIAPAGEIDG